VTSEEQSQEGTNIEHFKAQYGLSPAVVDAIWEDLQLTEIPGVCVHVNDWKIKYFLIALYHLKHYPTKLEQEAKFDVGPRLVLVFCGENRGVESPENCVARGKFL
jgi:hypothetical protein